MLLGNYTQLNANVGTNVGGFTNPYAWMQTSNMMAFYCGDAIVSGTSDKYSFNAGYIPPYSWHLAPKAGGLAMNITGLSSINFDLIPQYLAVADFTGSGDLTATIIGLGNIISAFTGSSSFTADINAKGNLSIDFIGSGGLTLDITGNGTISVAMTGSGTLNADLSLFLNMVCAMTGSGTLSADAALLVSMLCDMTGSSTMTASITGLKQMTASFTGSGNLAADITAFGNMIVSLIGSGDLDVDISAIADMSIDIVVTGTGLTTSNVGPAVWAAIASQNNVAGTMGEKLNDAGSASNPWSDTNTYGAGTKGELLQEMVNNIWGQNLPDSFAEGEAGEILAKIQTLVDELHRVRGLKLGEPATQTLTNLTAGDINIAVTGDLTDTTTFTRQP